MLDILQATIGSLASTITPSQADLTAAFVAELKRSLADNVGGELLVQVAARNLRADSVSLPGAASAAINLGFDLIVAAGPRAIAELEIQRLSAKDYTGDLTDEERNHRIDELKTVKDKPDRRAADDALRSLGLVPDDMVLELKTRAASDQPGLELSGIDLPVAQTRLDEVAGKSATLTITIPKAASERDEKERNEDGVPLYRIHLDVSGGTSLGASQTELLGRSAIVGPLEFAELAGDADVFPDRRVELDVTLHEVAFESLVWGIFIRAPGGRAATVHITGTVQLGDAGNFDVGDDAELNIDVDQITANRITLEKPGKFKAVAEAPILRGLHVVLADGALPSVRVDSGTINGFDGAVGALFHARSEEPLTFRDLNLDAIVDLGIYSFSFGDLESGRIDFEAAGNRLAVTYFDGKVEGIVTDQLSGSVTIEPERELALGRLSVHLNPLSDRFGAVDLGWSSLKLHKPRFELSWVFLSPPSADPAQAEEVTGLGLTLKGLHTDMATATGLNLATQLAGEPVKLSMEAQGEATVFGLDIPSLDLLITEDFVTVEGSVSGDSLIAQGLVAELGPLLELRFDAYSKQLRFDALSDGSKPFRLDDLEVEGNTVVLKNGQPLRSWFVHVEGDVSGVLDREGLDVVLDQPLVVAGSESAEFTNISMHADKDAVAVELEGGRYIGNHIRVEFDQLAANVVLGRPGDLPATFGNLNLNLGTAVGGMPILKFSEIRLKDAWFEIDDLGALIGRSELVQIFPALKDIADHMNGEASFTVKLKAPQLPWLLVTSDVVNGLVIGEAAPAISIKGTPVPGVPFTGQLFPALGYEGNFITMGLVALDEPVEGPWSLLGVTEVMIPWPVPPSTIAIATNTIDSVADVDANLDFTVNEIPIPGAGELHLQTDTKINFYVTGPTDNSLAVTLHIDPTDARTLLWDMFDFAAAGIRINKGVNLQVEFVSLTPRKVTGTIASGSIDAATLGVVGP